MNKITMDIIKKFKHCFQYNQLFEELTENYYFGEDSSEDIKLITWLYTSLEQTYCLIGVEDNYVYAIKDEGELVTVCQGLENVPYEMLRVATGDIEEETVEEIFKYDKKFEQDLIAYEAWCKENGIELDKEKIYHDSEGKLFTHYFRRPGEYLYE